MTDIFSVSCSKELVDAAVEAAKNEVLDVEDILRGITADNFQMSPEELPSFTMFVVPSDDERDKIIGTLNL